MATKLTLLSVNRGKGPFVEVTAQIVLSGNYAAGGDKLDLTTLYNQVDPNGNTLDSDLLPTQAEAESMGSVAGNNPNNFKVCTYTNPNSGAVPIALTPSTCLLQCYKGATEEAAGAYDNVFLSDYIGLRATFQSQR